MAGLYHQENGEDTTRKWVEGSRLLKAARDSPVWLAKGVRLVRTRLRVKARMLKVTSVKEVMSMLTLN